MKGQPRAVIYARKSADREGRELGIARQVEDAEAECARLGAVVAGVYSDNDISASTRSTKRRPEYERMLRDIRAGQADLIVSYSTSRLTRRPMEFERLIELAEQGVKIVTVRSGDLDLNTARGRRRARDDAARDCEYAEELSELAKRERQQRREQCRWNGGPRPFGWEKDGMTPRESEQALIREAADAVLAGRSLASVARSWTAALGGSPNGGAKCRPGTVRDVLMNPRVAGLMPDERPARWPAILDETTWRGVVALLGDPDRRRERGATRLLTGIAFCGLCGDDLVTINGGVTRSGTPTYRCPTRHLDRLSEPIDGYVTEVLLRYLARERVTTAEPGDDAGTVAREAEAIRARLGQLADLVADGSMTAAEYRPRADRLRRELEEAEARAARSLADAALLGLPLGIDALRAVWDEHADDPEWRRTVVKSAGLKITVFPAGRGMHGFNPETVRIEPA